MAPLLLKVTMKNKNTINESELNSIMDSIENSVSDIDSEFDKADRKKEYAQELFHRYKDTVEYYYREIIGKYITSDDFLNLLRAIYEVCAKRYYEAIRLKDASLIASWENFIHMSEYVYIAESEDLYMNSNVSRLVQIWTPKIKTTRDAYSAIMAVTMAIEDTIKKNSEELYYDNSEEDEHIDAENSRLLDVKDKADEEFLRKTYRIANPKI